MYNPAWRGEIHKHRKRHQIDRRCKGRPKAASVNRRGNFRKEQHGPSRVLPFPQDSSRADTKTSRLQASAGKDGSLTYE